MKTTKKFYGIVLALACGFVATLRAQDIYVANAGNDTIGVYGLDGSTVNAWLISLMSYDEPPDEPEGIAISGNDLFVVNTGNGTIGEYTTSGKMVNDWLITFTGLSSPSGIAIGPAPPR